MDEVNYVITKRCSRSGRRLGRLEAMKGRKTRENGTKPTRLRGRPAVRVTRDPIPDTPDNVVRALRQGRLKPADQWKFMKPGGNGYAKPEQASINPETRSV